MRFKDKESPCTEEFGSPDARTAQLGADPLRAVDLVLRRPRHLVARDARASWRRRARTTAPSVYAHEFSHILGVLDNYNNSVRRPRSSATTPAPGT